MVTVQTQPSSPSGHAGQFMQHLITRKILEYLVPDELVRVDLRLAMLQVLQFGSINRFFRMISDEHPVWKKICLSSMFVNSPKGQINRSVGLKDTLVPCPRRLRYISTLHASPIHSLQDWCTWVSILRCISKDDNRLRELKLHLKSRSSQSEGKENLLTTVPDDQIVIAENLQLDILKISLSQFTASLFMNIFPFVCGLPGVPKLYFKDWSSGVFPQCFSGVKAFRSTIVNLEFNTYTDDAVDLDLVSALFPGLVHLTCEFNSGCMGSLKLPCLRTLNLPSISVTESDEWLTSFFGIESELPSLEILAIKNHENDLCQDFQVMLETIFESWNLPCLEDLRLVLPKICQSMILKTISNIFYENTGRIRSFSLGHVYYDQETYTEFIQAVSAGLKRIELNIANHANFDLAQQECLLKQGLDLEIRLLEYAYLDKFVVSYS